MLIISFVLFAIAHQGFSFREQVVGVRGKLTCNGKNLNSADVKLIDKNFIGPDIILASTKTDSDGNYELSGRSMAFLQMSVHLKIFHDCDDRGVPCQRTVDLRIPPSYVERNDVVSNYFDAGSMNMAFKYPNEQRSCFNG
ncbi:unnamed protein product [Caenorhabditis auriculariae]|uniref:Uncharacterized protein n=1 Tax=Caenorhabditis auriculariae TaxID=2777116 RepID=A0A8S1GQS5_9PELO|nr:unnamed protein product [Caenorhabditis auriculariae]